MTEEWRDVVNCEGLYMVSNIGRVRSVPRDIVRSDGIVFHVAGKVLAVSQMSDGYVVVGLRINGKNCIKKVHRLVAKAFIDNPLGLPCVNHIDGDKSNNSVSNLEWVTYSENALHAVSFGLRAVNRYGESFKSSLRANSRRFDNPSSDGICDLIDGEEWVPIDGYHGAYEVSSFGRVRSLNRTVVRSDGVVCAKKGSLLAPQYNGRNGYLVSLSSDGKIKRVYVHRLVAEHFLGENDIRGMNVVHIDGDNSNNAASNLEVISNNELAKRKIARGVMKVPLHDDRSELMENLKKAQEAKKRRVVRSDGVVFNSLLEASASVGLASGSHISSCANGKRKTAGGYSWSWAR